VFGETYEPPPAHVTLYTRIDPQGIGLPNQAAFDQYMIGEVSAHDLDLIAPTELYERALRLAAKLHRKQTRKKTRVPYITHPVHVSVILLSHGFATDVAVAGLLHDVVEDQQHPQTAIEDKFGTRVAQIVHSLTERKQDEHGNERPWEDRKREGIERMKQANDEAVAVKVADTLHNARSIAMDVRKKGPKVWRRFNGSPQQMWNHYSEIAAVAEMRMPNHALVAELQEALDQLAELLPRARASASDFTRAKRSTHRTTRTGDDK
jgi:(p)ppGpp synthase/HD superfamily hydrolase